MCPEYNDQLQLSRTLCDKAQRELPEIGWLCEALPGEFNIAASTMFGGSYAGTYAGASEWAQSMVEEERKYMHVDDTGMRDEKARVIFKTGVTMLGTDDQVRLN